MLVLRLPLDELPDDPRTEVAELPREEELDEPLTEPEEALPLINDSLVMSFFIHCFDNIFLSDITR